MNRVAELASMLELCIVGATAHLFDAGEDSLEIGEEPPQLFSLCCRILDILAEQQKLFAQIGSGGGA